MSLRRRNRKTQQLRNCPRFDSAAMGGRYARRTSDWTMRKQRWDYGWQRVSLSRNRMIGIDLDDPSPVKFMFLFRLRRLWRITVPIVTSELERYESTSLILSSNCQTVTVPYQWSPI